MSAMRLGFAPESAYVVRHGAAASPPRRGHNLGPLLHVWVRVRRCVHLVLAPLPPLSARHPSW
jgi:hypothetical protein